MLKELGKQLLKKIKIVLHSKYFFFGLFLLSLIFSLVITKTMKYESKYKSSQTKFKVQIIDYKIDGNLLSATVKGKEKLKLSYYFTSEEEKNFYLKNIKYQDLLKEVKFGDISSKVGILSVEDFKFNSSLKNYFLSTTLDNKVYLYNGSLVSSKVNTKRNVRPCLGLKKDLEIISGNGSKMAPFIVEV